MPNEVSFLFLFFLVCRASEKCLDEEWVVRSAIHGHTGLLGLWCSAMRNEKFIICGWLSADVLSLLKGDFTTASHWLLFCE